MPHESTVAHEQRFVMETPMISRSRTFKLTEEDEEPGKPIGVSESMIDFFFYRFIELFTMQFQGVLDVDHTASQIPHARPETPRNVTHTHDEDCSDEDSDSQKQANAEGRKSSTRQAN